MVTTWSQKSAAIPTDELCDGVGVLGDSAGGERNRLMGRPRHRAIATRRHHRFGGSIRSMVWTRSIDRSNDATLLTPVLSAQATR